MEIELRFLVKNVPLNLNNYKKRELQDAYPFIEEPKYLRARRSDDKYTLTFKKGEGLVRVEKQIIIDKETFELLWRESDPKLKASRTRYLIPHGNKTIELDVFHGMLDGLVIAEIELDSENEKVALPEWIGEDITNNLKITNYITDADYVIDLVKKMESAKKME